jgi:hypothetical protein
MNETEKRMTEAERHQRFEDLCGGPDRAFRLLRIWSNSGPIGSGFSTISKMEVFQSNAKSEDYTNQQINAFLEL